ncbi:acyl-CoA N-acyltransferase [Microdochium trichocladiopsis]|uniref:Acyl-CoA N-acyltransferase n=1 Tax=Microdochium trichocladiopsis TaxID=1682393 RepID=A0A9P8YDC1_9PEZI|nr:acyl-CoA N-acyltransferase [Microdochium trichocladiopsis]KAH7039722.1 acyl-CoA N-acyltransferase [Microdochium trichocladiopsis]
MQAATKPAWAAAGVSKTATTTTTTTAPTAAAAAAATTSHGNSDLRLRAATAADLDDIVRIVKAGFPDDPEWDYRYPYRDEYPEDYDYWMRREYGDYLAQTDKFAVVVATLPELAAASSPSEQIGECGTRDVPVAVAVWDVAVTKDSRGDLGIGERKDANTVHMLALLHAFTAAARRYFSRHWERQYHLWALVTHPDYRRRGAGTALVRWGTRAAREKGGWAASVIASSPAGKRLYAYCGFEELGEVVVQIEGEEEKCVVWCMDWVLPKVEEEEEEVNGDWMEKKLGNTDRFLPDT